MKMLLTALALTVLPGLALAEGCQWGHPDETAASCSPGLTWDAQTRTCVSVTTS